MSEDNPGIYLLKMEGISKSFMGVPALIKVDLFIKKGEVHALMGENGAGKSTLMNILSGIQQKDSGSITFKGDTINSRNPGEALQAGISMIHQELNPVYNMSVSENIFLGKEPSYRHTGVINTKKQKLLTCSLFQQMDIDIDPDAKMRDLSIAQMQMVEIVRAVSFQSEIIIMDEPTSAISEKEVNKLFSIIKNLKAKGIAVIYISHKMEEIFKIADSVTVLRDGICAGTHPAGELDTIKLIRLMVGREISDVFPKSTKEKGPVLLEVENLSKDDCFENVKFSLCKKEILGFAGLIGSGRTEVVETLFGVHGSFKGRIRIDGNNIKISSPRDAIYHKIALIPEDRKLKGLNTKGSVKTNLTLTTLNRFCRLGQIIQHQKEWKFAESQLKKFGIKAAHPEQPVLTLSGGNQQKVVLSKWLATNPRILILDEPTRGIDIGAKAEIYKLINYLAEGGMAIILISSEMAEITGLCDRVIVFHEGKISGEFQRNEINEEKIMASAMGYS